MAVTKTDLPTLHLSNQSAISGQIYAFLRKLITDTTVKPGTVFSENELSSHFEVSRQPVREAISRLSAEGLLSVRPQSGSIVTRISVSKLRQVCFIRKAIETSALRNIPKLKVRQAGRILRELRDNLTVQEETLKLADSSGRFLLLDDGFHELVCSFSLCPMAWQTVQSVKGQMDRIRYLSMNITNPAVTLLQEHRAIYAALAAKDLELAVTLLSRHLDAVMETYVPIREHYAAWFVPETDDLLLSGA